MNKEKQIKIIKIMDEYTVIINSGSNDGVQPGDRFQILDTKGNAVKDPDTGETLGYLDLIKDTVKVTEVQEKICFCSSLEAVGINDLLATNLMNLNNSLPFSGRKQRLNVDLDDVTGGREKSDVPIKIGDKVRLLKL